MHACGQGRVRALAFFLFFLFFLFCDSGDPGVNSSYSCRAIPVIPVCILFGICPIQSGRNSPLALLL